MANSIVKVQDGYNHEKMTEDLRILQNTSPEIEVIPIGRSVLGRSIPAVRLGTGPKEIHFNGSFHANEWITSLLLMVFIERVVQSCNSKTSFDGISIEAILKDITLWIVPMVNPDGVELVQNGFLTDNNPYYRTVLEANKGSTDFQNWKANIRGVDLNDQFPAYWENECNRRETNGPAPSDYPGPAPLSEPEAQAMANFTLEHDFQLVIALHTQGEEIYWGYRNSEPPESQRIVQQFEKVSGYKAIQNVDSDAGYKDWFICQWQRPGFTVECGKGQNPLPVNQFWSIWPKTRNIMLASLFA
ncbi:MAG: Gamma-D-glutamyl-L-diamino acid endopeptidase 1 [Candidatus Dichloromethanomonas elyunquensis]|nr:MAG: Gamma-D-glutamyl-L-diamino acid endopeptidase 1 [Candidatus Dichloromethanomonas elyunquensis]